MKAIRQYEFGPAETLRYEEVPDPRPGPGQLRIKTAVSGVNPLDAAIRAGTAGGHPFADPQLPMTPGREIAGVVDELGDGVPAEWLGRRVVTHLGIASGGYAQLAIREAEAVHVIPEGLSYQAAAAMIATGRTAIGVFDVAQITEADTVVITAAAGGVGSLLVQAAAEVGATVIGAAGGPEKTARVAALAPGVIAVDYNLPDWADQVRERLAGRAVTCGIDGVGGEAGRVAFDLLGACARFILIGWSSGELVKLSADDVVARSLSVTSALGPRMTARPGGWRSLETEALERAATGRLVPLLQTFSLEQAAEAHRALENRGTVGKVVLTS